jgi:heptose I phosphotransferase
MVAELVDHAPLHEAIPELARTLDPAEFSRIKRSLVIEMAGIAARLHAAHAFHKDLYLCHFFLDLRPSATPGKRLCLIDLHRLAVHRHTAARWRWKDLGQLLFSTYDVVGIDDRDRLRFWRHYRRRLRMALPSAQLHCIKAKAALYLAHNRDNAA